MMLFWEIRNVIATHISICVYGVESQIIYIWRRLQLICTSAYVFVRALAVCIETETERVVRATYSSSPSTIIYQ